MKWGISIRGPKASKMIVVEGFKKAKRVGIAAKRKFQDRPEIVVELVSRTKAFDPPEGWKARGGQWWCPYCRKARKFYLDSYLNVKRCPVCGATESCFHVRTANGLWGPSLKRRRR